MMGVYVSNSQLMSYVIEEAKRLSSEEVNNSTPKSEYESIKHAFVESLKYSLKETKNKPESNEDFLDRTVGNFIIMSGNAGYSSDEIDSFLTELRHT